MNRIRSIVLAAAAAFVLTGCESGTYTANNGANTANKSANTVANTNTAGPAAAAPTKESLFAIEKTAWEGWKNNDSKAIADTLSTKFVGFGPAGREDKATSMTNLTNMKCEVKSYSFSDEQMDMIGPDVAVISFKAAQEGVCSGKPIPTSVWVSSVYAREGDKWMSVAYVQNPVTDPKAPPAKAAAPIVASTAKADELTESLLKVDTAAWDAWKNRDVKGVEAVMAKDFHFVSGTGRQDRAAAIKAWSEPKCQGLAYTFGEPQSVSLSKDVALLTYKADAKGACDGKPVTPTIWATSISVKEGDAWKNAFYTDVPR